VNHVYFFCYKRLDDFAPNKACLPSRMVHEITTPTNHLTCFGLVSPTKSLASLNQHISGNQFMVSHLQETELLTT